MACGWGGSVPGLPAVVATREERGGIASDPNPLDDKQYIFRLISQVITVSLETQRVILCPASHRLRVRLARPSPARSPSPPSH